MMKPLRRSRKENERGQSMVEFAACLPLLLLILLGTIDVSRLFFDYIQMRQAVVEGATYGQRHSSDLGGVYSVVAEHYDQTHLPAGLTASASADSACNTPGATGNVRVTASNTFTPLYSSTLNGLASYFGGSVNWNISLSATSTMRCFT